MKRRPWTDAELSILRDRYPHERTNDLAQCIGRPVSQVFNKANALGLHKTPETIARLARESLAQRGDRARASQFKPGGKPWNAGLHFHAGGRSVETQFRKGSRLGSAELNYQPVGAERISKDGYLERKINDDLPYYKRWRAVHLLVWEEANGPVPEGQALTFIDGDKRNVSLGNLCLVHRADLMRRNSIHNYGPEIARLVQLQGAISRQINKRGIKE